MKILTTNVILLAILSGCAAHKPKTVNIVPKATDAQVQDTFGKLKSLAGRWEVTSENGMKGETVFNVSSVGSAVREVMFPGTDHEMTNMYHMDGACCIATHYCGGNTQPRMKACEAEGNTVNFVLERTSNVTNGEEGFMGGLAFVFISPDHVEQRWTKVTQSSTAPFFTFTLKRIADK